MHKRETVCLHGARNVAGFKQLGASEGVSSKLIGDGGAIGAQTASAAITGSNDARGVLSYGQASLFLGRVTVKVEPFPTVLSTVMVPP